MIEYETGGVIDTDGKTEVQRDKCPSATLSTTISYGLA